MPRANAGTAAAKNNHQEQLLSLLIRNGNGGGSLEERVCLAASFRRSARDASQILDRFLLDACAKLQQENTQFQEAMRQARGELEKLEQLVKAATAPPLYPATVLGLSVIAHRPAVLVRAGNHVRVVTIADEVNPSRISIGDEVLLGEHQNQIVARSTFQRIGDIEIGDYERTLPDGRLVVSHCGGEVLVLPSAVVEASQLRKGTKVRFDRVGGIALEALAQSEGNEYWLEEMPETTFADVAGLDAEIQRIREVLTLHYLHPDAVQRYGVPRIRSIRLCGPPGNGKTLIGRACANFLGTMNPGGKAHFMNVKPSSFGSVWYSQTEANIRAAFAAAKAAGLHHPRVPVVMFIEEADSLLSHRGESLHKVHSDVTNAFLAELDGLESCGNILVIATTNRLTGIDSAALRAGRLGDLQIVIPRPNRRAATAILQRHLEPELPYAGPDPATARHRIIQAVISALFSANGNNHIATVMFRDSKVRKICARDAISGADLAKIARIAKERACRRFTECGDEGIRLEDLYAGMDEFIDSAQTILADPIHCTRFVDLPQDADVVRVDPAPRPVRDAARYRMSLVGE